MRDRYARNITYLRLSVTDLCSLRCRYCMPAGGVPKRDRGDVCSLEELVEITQAAVDCGVRKVRLTGGEPLVRRGILDLCRGVPPFRRWRSCASPPTARPSPNWQSPSGRRGWTG